MKSFWENNFAAAYTHALLADWPQEELIAAFEEHVRTTARGCERIGDGIWVDYRVAWASGQVEFRLEKPKADSLTMQARFSGADVWLVSLLILGMGGLWGHFVSWQYWAWAAVAAVLYGVVHALAVWVEVRSIWNTFDLVHALDERHNLSVQQSRWLRAQSVCPACGLPFTPYDGECRQCGLTVNPMPKPWPVDSSAFEGHEILYSFKPKKK